MDTTIRSNISMLNDITPQGDLHAKGTSKTGERQPLHTAQVTLRRKGI